MKIVFIATRPYHPVIDGRTYTLDTYVKALCEEHEVHYICFSDTEEVNNVYSCKSITILKNSSTKEKLKNIFFKCLFGGKPLQCAAVYSKSNQKLINEVVSKVDPDIVIFDMIRMAIYKKKLPKSKTRRYVLDMDDILSNRYNKESKESILGTFASKVPNLVNKIFKNKAVNRMVTSSERRRMKRLEKKAPKKYGGVVLVSQKEVNALKELTKRDNIWCWPVVAKSSKDALSGANYDKQTILFLGNLLIPQNLATFDYIVSDIMPSLPGFTLKVIGKTNEELKSKKYSCKVVFMNFVENLEEEARKCLALVAPIQFGTGIKIKVVEMMGLGLPVITSPVGVEGLNLRKEDGFLVCQNQKDYVSNINVLCKEPSFRRNIIEKQIKYIDEFHNYSLLKSSINNLLEEVTK